MDVLLYCIATSPIMSSDGLTYLSFDDWSGLNGSINPNVLTMLAEKSSKLKRFDVYLQTELSANEQKQILDFSVTLANTSEMLAIIAIYEISPLSSEQTSAMFTAWGSTSSLTVFDGIVLDNADFTEDSTCEVVANFINDATNLSWMESYYQNSERPITIVLTPASAEGMNDGSIVVRDCTDGGQPIYTMSTSRTDSFDFWTNSCSNAAPTRQRKQLRK